MVYIILGTGFEDMEAVAVFDVLKRGGVDVQYAGIGSGTIESAHGMKVEADCLVTEIDFDIAEMVVIPGGLGGVCAIESSPEAKTAILIAHAKELLK
ncbi:MAG: DJ-1/PfpI family protein, partial [Oscillospiraceae bacterium]|nr:DJ-1/PfpI family protein [Oscillospiraceae bacterium]